MFPFLKAIFLDFDGVIVNPFKHLVAEILAVADSFGVRNPLMEKIKKHWGESLEEFLGNVLPGINREMFLERSGELGFRMTAPPLVVGARRTLALLSNQYLLAIVTNRGRPSLLAVMEEREIDRDLFRFIHTASDLPRHHHKPSPKAFRRLVLILSLEGILPDQILYVGDNEIDFKAASGAGLHFVGITSGGPTTREDFLRAGVSEKQLLESIRDLPGFLGLLEE